METTPIKATQDFIEAVRTWFQAEALDLVFKLLGIILILIVGKILIIILRRFFRTVLRRSKKINDLMAQFLLKVVSVIGWMVVLLIVLDQLGVNLAPIIAGLGVTGFILGFAFQESIGNLLSGVMIVLNSPFRIGDYVDVGSFV